MRPEKLIIFSAPSGTGKGTVIRRIMELTDHVKVSVSATTRSPREGEQDGVDYHFISRETFEEMIERGEFLEYAEYSGNYYGTPLAPLEEQTDAGNFVILEIEVQGFLQVKEKIPEALAVFLKPPSLKELEQRLRGRGTDSEESIRRRLKTARKELPMAERYDCVVVNDEVDRAAGEIIEIIRTKRGVNEI